MAKPSREETDACRGDWNACLFQVSGLVLEPRGREGGQGSVFCVQGSGSRGDEFLEVRRGDWGDCWFGFEALGFRCRAA